jgi:hypothetical protein
VNLITTVPDSPRVDLLGDLFGSPWGVAIVVLLIVAYMVR